MQGTNTVRRIAGRAALGAVAITAIIAIPTTVMAGKGGGHSTGTATASCSLSASGWGAPLTLTGGGYAPNTSYTVKFTWPAGAGSAATGAWSDATGHLSVSTYAYWQGLYAATVSGAHGKTLSTCSTSVA